MLGAVQLGLLAACVVLFVPMVMAGWHLSRNKMLFFSGALFITLAIGVHLTPYFPSVSDLVSSVSTVMVVETGDPCVSLLHEIAWDVKPVEEDLDRDRNRSRYEENWNWTRSNRVRECGFQRLGKADSSDLLNGSWVVVAGDSQARLIALSLLGLVLDSEKMGLVRDDLFKRHSDYRIEIVEMGMKLDFIWAPYTSNLTDMALKLKQDRNYPDVLVMGSGLWHMLHITNAVDYGISLQLLRSAVMQLLPFYPEMASTSTSSSSSHEELGSVRSPHMFWLGMPMLVNGMLNTVEKREKMTDELWHSYDQELRKSKLLHQSGGPLFLLDVQSLSWNCGPRCTIDGMHYSEPVYEAATHIMLNALLIESHQRLDKG